MNGHVAGELTDLDVPAEQRARAVRVVASAAVDAADCRMLLDMLGLNPRSGAADVPKPRDPIPAVSTVD